MHGDTINVYNVLIGKLKGKVYHGRLSYNMDHTEITSVGAVEIPPGQDIHQQESHVNLVRNLCILRKVYFFLSF
jgi:hypothetical protein